MFKVGDWVRIREDADHTNLEFTEWAYYRTYVLEGRPPFEITDVYTDEDGTWYTNDWHYLLGDIEFEAHELEAANE
jgi:hypothetical protein